MHKVLIASVLVCTLVLVSACSNPAEKLEITTITQPRPPLVLADPDVLTLRSVGWLVLTKDNFEEEMLKMEEKGVTPVVFALTTGDYENLALNLSDLRTYLQQQKAIIVSYAEYINE